MFSLWQRWIWRCVSNLTIIDSDNGLSPGRRRAIIWTSAGILLIGPLGTNFNDISIAVQTFPFKKMHLKMSSAKWRPLCLGLYVLSVNVLVASSMTSQVSDTTSQLEEVDISHLCTCKILLMWHQSLQLDRPDTHRDTHTTGCHHCSQTLTIDHMLLECPLLQECRDEYYTVDSLNALFGTIPEICIIKFLREAGFFYLIWCNLLTSTSPETCTIWSDLSNYLENESNSETHLLV